MKLAARGDAELREDPAEVVRHRPVRDVELLPDFTVGQTLGRQAGDLELLGRQLISSLRDPTAARDAGGAELLACALSPGTGAESIECLARGA